MDIERLREWATFMDRAVVVSLVATVMAVAALATTTWLSFRVGNSVRTHEQAAFDRDKGEMEKRSAGLEQEVATERKRVLELQQAVAEANARAGQAARESATANEKAHSAEIDAEEVRKRVAELGKAVMEARARAPDPAQAVAAETPRLAAPESAGAGPQAPSPAPPPIVASIAKYAGTKAAVYVLEEARDGPAVAATISGYLGDAGWTPLTWTWTGVGGILGVVVLLRDDSDRPTSEAASALLDALRSAGFNATKGSWPADWRRYRGTLTGPQAPLPTDAAIRIVIGSKAR